MTALATRIRRLLRRGQEAGGSGGGSAMVLLIGAGALFIVLALVIDGGTKARALDRANQLAYEAARTGLQVAAPSGPQNTRAIEAAAESYLATHGATGDATVIGDQVQVDVTISEPTKALGAIGINQFTVTGHGVAYLVYGQ